MKTCAECGKPILPKPHANNVKYCSTHCRNKAEYRIYRKQWQKDWRDMIASEPDDNKLQCQICGKWYKQVGSHIYQEHKMTAREYRKEYGFDLKKGQTTGDYKELKHRQVFQCGGVKNLITGKKFRFHKGQKGIGVYTRSAETLERLKTLYKLNKGNKK